MLPRFALSLPLGLLLVVSAVVGQSRSDSVQVWSAALAEFAKRAPIFLEAYQALPGRFNQLGPRHQQLWLDSMDRDARISGVCDTVSCTRPRPNDYDMVRLSAPRFAAADTAHLYVLRTLQWGPGPGCNTGEEASYDVLLVRAHGRWTVRSNRPGSQALYADSLCAAKR